VVQPSQLQLQRLATKQPLHLDGTASNTHHQQSAAVGLANYCCPYHHTAG
jgi:hypothetical protein